MRRAVIALVTAITLMVTGLTPGSLRASALGETSVTLSCSDGTSLTVLVGADALAGLTAAVQGMIDYPAGLSCTLVKNPLPLGAVFGNLALAANPNTMVVAGGRWLVPCTLLGGLHTATPSGELAQKSGPRPGLAKVMPRPLASTPCPIDDLGCVFVNIAVNLHFRDKSTNYADLEGTLNETIPGGQFCPNVLDGNGQPIPLGPSHFTSKPTPAQTSLVGCLTVQGNLALTTTFVTEVSGSGLGFASLLVNDMVRFRFMDNGNPSQGTDRLIGPPLLFDDSNCEAHFFGADPIPPFELEHGNINIYGQVP
jgi:hypothetical protein